MKIWTRFFILLLTGVLASCNNSNKKTGAETSIVSLTIGSPATLDPHQFYDSYTREILINIYDSLIEYKKGSTYKFLPRIAANVPSEKEGTITNGGKTYIFTIKKGITFQNGNGLTPEDVEYSMERNIFQIVKESANWFILDPLMDSGSLKEAVEKFTGKGWDEIFDEYDTPHKAYVPLLTDFYHTVVDPVIEVSGDMVIVSLKKPFPPFLSLIAHYGFNGWILDKEWCISKGLWDGKPDTWWKYLNKDIEHSPLYSQAMGSGPYKLVKINRNKKTVVLEGYEKYFKGPPAIKKIKIKVVEDWRQRKALYEAGKAHTLWVNLENYSEAKQLRDIKIYNNLPGMALDTGIFFRDLDQASPYIGSGKLDGEGIPPDFFQDINVRLGFIHAFDYDTFISDKINKAGTTIPTCLISGLLGYDENLESYNFYLEKAALHLKKAYNGRLWKNGFKMNVVYNKGNTTRKLAAQTLAHGLKTINPKFIIEPVELDWPELLDAYKNYIIPYLFIGWVVDYPDPNSLTSVFYHSKGDCGAYYGESYKKFAGTPHKELDNMSLDTIIEKAFSTTDPEKRVYLYKKIQQFAKDQALSMPIFQPKDFVVMHKKIKGWYFNPLLDANFYDYYPLYISE